MTAPSFAHTPECPFPPGTRVLIRAGHPWGNHTGTVEESFRGPGGQMWAVKVDGAAGSRAGCAEWDMTKLEKVKANAR